jgi:tRNA dimethylallyltransferase
VGPTAAGKTAVAHHLARGQGFEILSADSMLIYRGLDIGTAKPTPRERVGIHYHGLDLVDPDQPFSVGAFLEHARAVFADCAARGVRVLVAGGTGLYVRALLHGLDSAPPADLARRDYWTARLAADGAEALRSEAEHLCPGILDRMPDARNPRRLIRVLERLEQGADPLPGAPLAPVSVNGSSPSSEGLGASPCSVTPPLPGLWFEPDVLRRRIAQRVDRMFADGLLDETRRLTAAYPAWSDTARAAIGYAEALAVLSGELTETVARERIAVRTRQLAKRQRTWYRHQLSVGWIDGPVDEADVARAAAEVAAHWREHGPHTVLRS